MGLYDNPYQQNKFGTTNYSLLDPSKPAFGTTPNVATFGSTEVVTNKPIITTNKMSLPTGNFKRELSQAEKDFKARMKVQSRIKQDEAIKPELEKAQAKNWWEARTKKQKALIIGGTSIVVLLGAYMIYKTVKK
jgi:hypothetical protein